MVFLWRDQKKIARSYELGEDEEEERWRHEGENNEARATSFIRAKTTL